METRPRGFSMKHSLNGRIREKRKSADYLLVVYKCQNHIDEKCLYSNEKQCRYYLGIDEPEPCW